MIRDNHRRYTFCLAAAMGGFICAGAAQDKVTFVDAVLPLVEQHCAKCHNPDKRKGDLDLTSHSGVLKGGGTGPVVVAGSPDSSKLIKSIAHVEEPNMPPNKPPLPEKDLAIFRSWIAGGLLETSGSKAMVAVTPRFNLALTNSDSGKPKGPPPMPADLALDPFVRTKHPTAVAAIAASPWAPLVAIAGQKQVLLYNSTNRNLLGILPFTDGQPLDVRFSHSGKVLLVAGGHGAQSGTVVLWDVETGKRLASVGKEYDAVLTADLSPDQARVAVGGTDRMLKVYLTSNGELEHRIKKHTDWVTAVAFSPNGEMLASGDRNGGVTVWDPESGQELFTTAGHKGPVTSLSWRSDSRLLASASEDGNVILWDSSEGKQVKSWAAHKGGVLDVAYARDGRLVTCGRDGFVMTWSASGTKQKTLTFGGEMAVHCAWTDDGAQVVAGDFTGQVSVWDASTGLQAGLLDVNPKPMAARIEEIRARILEIQDRGDKPSPAVAEARRALSDAEAALTKARTSSEAAQAAFAEGAKEVVRLKEVTAKADAPADIAAQLAAARAKREKARAMRADTANAVDAGTLRVKAAKARADQLTAAYNPALEMAEAKAELERLLRSTQRAAKAEGPAQSVR